MKLTSTILAAVAASLAYAQDVVLPTPEGGQIGLLHFPITCTVLYVTNLTLDGVFTATAPLQGQTGQEIYYTDVTAILTIPGFVTESGSLVGVSYANALVHVGLELTNASPSEYAVFPDGLWVNNTKLNPYGDTPVRVPQGTGVLPPIGPITLGAANTTHNIGLGPVNLKLYLYNSTGGLILGDIDVTCPTQDPNVLIGLVNIDPDDGSQGTPFAPANGFEPDFPEIGLSQEYGCFNFDYQCRLGIFGPFPFNVVACGGIDTYDKPGEQFYLENVTSRITIPSDVVDATRNLFPGATEIDTTIETFFIEATYATPAALNGLPSPISLVNSIPASGDLSLSFPSTGHLTVGPFTASDNVGQLMYLLIGNSTSHAIIRNSTHADIGEVDIVCATEYPVELIGIIISDVDPEPVSPSVPALPSFPSFGGSSSSSAAGFSFPTALPSFFRS